MGREAPPERLGAGMPRQVGESTRQTRWCLVGPMPKDQARSQDLLGLPVMSQRSFYLLTRVSCRLPTHQACCTKICPLIRRFEGLGCMTSLTRPWPRACQGLPVARSPVTLVAVIFYGASAPPRHVHLDLGRRRHRPYGALPRPLDPRSVPADNVEFTSAQQ